MQPRRAPVLLCPENEPLIQLALGHDHPAVPNHARILVEGLVVPIANGQLQVLQSPFACFLNLALQDLHRLFHPSFDKVRQKRVVARLVMSCALTLCVMSVDGDAHSACESWD